MNIKEQQNIVGVILVVLSLLYVIGNFVVDSKFPRQRYLRMVIVLYGIVQLALIIQSIQANDKEKLRKSLLGFIVVNIFIFSYVLMIRIRMISTSSPHGTFHLSEPWKFYWKRPFENYLFYFICQFIAIGLMFSQTQA